MMTGTVVNETAGAALGLGSNQVQVKQVEGITLWKGNDYGKGDFWKPYGGFCRAISTG